MKTDTTEKGLESLIMRHMTGADGLSSGAAGVVAEAAPAKGGSGWFAGNDAAYDREFAVDSGQLFSFLIATQPEEWAKLGIANYKDKQGMARQKFLARLQGEITRRGVIDVLRHGIKHGALSFDLFYGKPSAENAKAVERHAKNRFSITRQLHFSQENKRSLDLCAFINGLPVITFELKNSLTKQTGRTPSSNTNATAIHARRCFSSAAASFTLRWMTMRWRCVPPSKARAARRRIRGEGVSQ